MSKPKKPNRKLQHEREIRGWSQARLAQEIGTDEKRIGVWERGESRPGPFFRSRLCELFGKDAKELGFLDEATHDGFQGENLRVQAASSVQHHAAQAVDLPSHFREDVTPDQQSGLWLALSIQNLTPLFDEGWTPHMILEALHVLLPGVHAMSQISRRAFGQHMLQLGATAFLSGIPVPTGKHVSAEERMRLCQTLGESIAAGWKLFHTVSNAQVLAVGQAQLLQVQEASAYLYSDIRPMYYSGVYRLIGAALHFQGRYEEARQVQERAYIAALEGADAWNMAQSRGWQAYGLKTRGQYLEAIHTADTALRLVSSQQDTESIRLQARLLAFSAETAALLGRSNEAQRRLDASEKLLEFLPGAHEEFDRTSWLQQAGTCALNLKQYDLAIQRLQQSLDELPSQWTLRSVSTAIPLVRALIHQKDRTRALAMAEQTLSMIHISQSPALAQEFMSYMQKDLLACFPTDSLCQNFVVRAEKQLARNGWRTTCSNIQNRS